MATTKPLNERTWLSIVLVLFLYVIVLYVPQIIMGILDVSAPADDIVNLVIYSVFWFSIIPFGLKMPRKVESLKDYLGSIQLSNAKPLGLILFLGVLMGVLYLLITAVVSFMFGLFAPNVESIFPPGNWVLLYGNIGAFFEEVAIRGVILTLLLMRYDKTKAAFLSALIFGTGHIITYFLGNELFFSVIQVVYAFSLGVLFAALVIKTNSLIPSIIAHMIMNSFVQMFQGPFDDFNYPYLLLISSVITTVLGLVILKYIPRKIDDKTAKTSGREGSASEQVLRSGTSFD